MLREILVEQFLLPLAINFLHRVVNGLLISLSS